MRESVVGERPAKPLRRKKSCVSRGMCLEYHSMQRLSFRCPFNSRVAKNPDCSRVRSENGEHSNEFCGADEWNVEQSQKYPRLNSARITQFGIVRLYAVLHEDGTI